MRETGGGSSGLVALCSRKVGQDCIAGGCVYLQLLSQLIQVGVLFSVSCASLFSCLCVFLLLVMFVSYSSVSPHSPSPPYVSFKPYLITLVRYKQGKTSYPSVLRLGACWGVGTMKAENKREKKTERNKYDRDGKQRKGNWKYI